MPDAAAGMDHRPLGATGLHVSALSLGTMTFGGGPTIGGLGQADADALVGMALDAGVNLFDTANGYAGGEAERMLGKALGSRRDEVLVASKVRLKTGRRGVNDVGLSRGHILAAVGASLERLGTDYLDLYQLHIPDAKTPLDETLRALEDLVRWGQVRYVGCCNYPAWHVMKGLAIADRHGWTRFASMQVHYSLASRELEREIVPLAADQGLGLLIWSPLAGGLLSGKFGADVEAPEGSRRTRFDFPPVDRQRAFAVVDVLRDIATAHDATPARVALAWLLHRPFVTSVILGARRPEQLTDNLAAAQLHLAADELDRLDAVSAIPREYPQWMLEHPWDDRVSEPPGWDRSRRSASASEHDRPRQLERKPAP
jgi:aryl-alcohol dehydrogenase-like predicted oxidoreductase